MNTGLEGKRTMHDTSIFEKIVLDNGVTIWRQYIPFQVDRKGIIAACLPNVGSICDPPELPGLAHFFEHAPFLGTTSRPNYTAVHAPIEDLAGHIGASTSQSWIRYHCILPQEYFKLAVTSVYELAAQALFRPEDIILERGNILEEWKRYHAQGDSVSAAAMIKAFYQHEPLGNPIIGYPETISAITSDDIRAFFNRHFVSGNFHVVIGGAFALSDDVLSLVVELFSTLPAKPADTPTPLRLPQWKGRHVILNDTDFKRDWLYMSWFLDGNVEKAASRIADHLGQDMTSPLISLFRGKMGSAYEKGWGSTGYFRGITSLGFNMPINVKHFSLAQDTVYHELEKLTPEKIIREQSIAQIARDYQCPHPTDVAKGAVVDLTNYGRIKSIWEHEAENDELTVEEVMAVRDFLLGTRPFICEARAS
jgi:predicted Zn-dependent peptidase